MFALFPIEFLPIKVHL